MSEEIKVSIIMPVYNSGIYLSKAVESILSQSFRDFELILVDDGSSDGSSEKCDEYAAKDSRVIVIHQKNGGICNARNAAIGIAKGEYIGFSDHDDEYLPGLLENAYQRAKKDDADLVKFCKKEQIINGDVTIRERETKVFNAVLKGKEIEDNYLLLLNKMVLDCVWDSLIRKDVLIKNNIYFDERYRAGGEDIDFITRLLRHVKVLSLMDKCYYMHYIRTGFSTSSKYNPVKLKSALLLAESITEGAKALGVNLYDRRAEYVYQMTFTLLNGTASLLSNRNCEMTSKEKCQYLDNLRKESFLPDWLFKQSPLMIIRISKRYAFSYFLYKHRFYSAMLLLSKLRDRQLLIKSKLS